MDPCADEVLPWTLNFGVYYNLTPNIEVEN